MTLPELAVKDMQKAAAHCADGLLFDLDQARKPDITQSYCL